MGSVESQPIDRRGSATDLRSPVILVLGMARSGTSAVARVLSQCGARLPDALLGADGCGSNQRPDTQGMRVEFLRYGNMRRRSGQYSGPGPLHRRDHCLPVQQRRDRPRPIASGERSADRQSATLLARGHRARRARTPCGDTGPLAGRGGDLVAQMEGGAVAAFRRALAEVQSAGRARDAPHPAGLCELCRAAAGLETRGRRDRHGFAVAARSERRRRPVSRQRLAAFDIAGHPRRTSRHRVAGRCRARARIGLPRGGPRSVAARFGV